MLELKAPCTKYLKSIYEAKAMLEYGGTELKPIEIENGFEKRIWIKTKNFSIK